MPEIAFTIKNCPAPKKNSKNVFIRGGKPVVIPSDRYMSWHRDASLQIKAMRIKPKEPIKKTIMMAYYFHLPDNRRRDMGNMAESLDDLLVDMGIIADDCWQVVPMQYRQAVGVDKGNPRVDVKIAY